MSRVFVTQEPSLRVPGGWQPKFDLSPAREFGELVVMMEPGNATPDTAQECVHIMKRQVFSDGDYLLALGDPVLIAIAAAVMSKELDEVRMLRWDGRAGRYVAFSVRL